MKVDLWFPIVGTTLPSDHGYGLYGALCRQVPQLHGARWWALHTVRGVRAAPGVIALSRAPRLGVRLPPEHIPLVLPLAGRLLDVGGTRIRLGAPTVEGMNPHQALSARIVTIKPFVEPDSFQAAVEKQIATLGVSGAVAVGARKVLTVDGRKIVGFSIRVAGLDGGSSLRLQEEGVGGRRHMGCGVFRRSVHENRRRRPPGAAGGGVTRLPAPWLRSEDQPGGHMNPLLAKSPRGKDTLTLLKHLTDTEQAASELFRTGTRWSRSYLRFFRLAPEAHGRFLLNLRLAALFHDIGKANEDFQAAMVAKGFKAQSLRHEHLSALLLCEPAVSSWLAVGADVDVDVVTAAVLSHHLKAAQDGDWKVLNPKHATPTKLFFNDQQVSDALSRIADVAGIAPFTGAFPAERYCDHAWAPAWEALFARATRFGRDIGKKNPERLKLTLAVKAGLIVSDSVSSGLVREGLGIQKWIEAVAHRPALEADEIDEKILVPRKAQLSKAGPFAWHSFQEGAAEVGRRGLLLAGCGAGKTLAAWRWASAVSQREEVARVIFLYPTRGTATEGFRDYVAHAPEGEAALVHGTSAYELAGMMENPPESLQGKNVAISESDERLFSLGLWNKRFFSATVDQFLGFMEHGYGGLCLVPALADAAVIFDEVHSYDPRMWNALVTFLERFDVPALCMTATLSRSRRDEIERHLRTYPTVENLPDLQDLVAAEEHPRYRLASSTRDDAVDVAVAAVHAGQRVLWVVNTVKRCQHLARLLQAKLGSHVNVGVYHSRFKLEDRQRRHRVTVDAFRAPALGEPAPAIAVTTQVCEMSLDLDADLLVTEHAPISSLVQRFGRANRHLRRGKAFRAVLLTYQPESNLPYEKKELEASSRFLAELSGKDVSQRDLADGLKEHALDERNASGSTAFVDGGYFATPSALRDNDDVGAAVVLDGDIARFKQLTRAEEPVDGLVVTVPKKHARRSDGTGLPDWLGLADSARYDPWLGFLMDDEPNPRPGAGHE